ncbi:MAG: ABC transporter substrate-binding protein [Rhodopseudomonas sp.]|uniref:ABC transporter substrate-binding protein n=1 Tax=Rhodopseudomonas sp. TaxID=1078 RepID=UPI00182CE222|nr:ABC transporter substrate-binding protein [Rhodopseudomonas sp.]NVN84968.1 ABC transporter substrate-binding protein [Rhodopseudomonas sp.]
MIRWLVGAIGLCVVAPHALAADPVEIGIGYLGRSGVASKLSLVEQPAGNDGIAGARLAIEDNNTTGKFLNQHFSLEEVRLGDGDDAAEAATALASRNGFIIADLPTGALLKAADALRERGTVLFNAGSTDDLLREEQCRANLIHVAPTRSMLADALAQYLVWKQWKRWLLVVGSHEADKAYAAALRRAAARFGAKIVQERVFEDTGGARRTDSGVTLIQRQMPVFTQAAPAYDVLVAADESEVFASYLPYRTWDARPVAGSAGLVPTSWDAAQDQWGAIQMQNRFIKLNSRRMTALDMQAWTAARMIGEAATRVHSGDAKLAFDFIKGPDFSIAAFKGQRLTLRDWNLQLRQPILLVDGRMVVSVSPQEGFLHQVSELDTLGVDHPETKCKLQ